MGVIAMHPMRMRYIITISLGIFFISISATPLLKFIIGFASAFTIDTGNLEKSGVSQYEIYQLRIWREHVLFFLYTLFLLSISYLTTYLTKIKFTVLNATLIFILSLVPLYYLHILGWHFEFTELELAIAMSIVAIGIGGIFHVFATYRYNKPFKQDK
jgi:hypothetical protein